MDSKERQKMCTSCDGRIPVDAKMCPYCRAELGNREVQASFLSSQHHSSIQKSLTSLYPPPYAAKTVSSVPSEEKDHPKPIKEPMSERKFNPSMSSLGAPSLPVNEKEVPHHEGNKVEFWPILTLSLGANLLVIGLLQLFFSDQGVLRLEWNSSHWFFYCLAAVPFFLFGWKKAKALTQK